MHASLEADVGTSHWKLALHGDLDGMRVIIVTQGWSALSEGPSSPLRR